MNGGLAVDARFKLWRFLLNFPDWFGLRNRSRRIVKGALLSDRNRNYFLDGFDRCGFWRFFKLDVIEFLRLSVFDALKVGFFGAGF